MKRSFRTRGENRPQYANKPAQRQTSSNHPYCEKTQSARGRENEAKQRKRANWEKDELEVSWGQEHWENRKEVNRNPVRVNLGQIWTSCMHGSNSPALAMMVQNLSFRKYICHSTMLNYPPKHNQTTQSAPQNTPSVTHAPWRYVLVPCCESLMFRSILVTANESLPTDPNATECAKSQMHHHRTHTNMPV